MAGGRKTLYNNQPVEVLKKLAAASIKDGEVGLVSLGGWHSAAHAMENSWDLAQT